jgi:hypothetical protein
MIWNIIDLWSREALYIYIYIYIRRTVRRTGPKSLQLFNFFDACSSLRLHTHTHTHITHTDTRAHVRSHAVLIFPRLWQAQPAHTHTGLIFGRLQHCQAAHTRTHTSHTDLYTHRLNFSRRLRRARDAHRHTHTRTLTHSLDFCRVCGRFKLHTPTQA